MTHSTSPAFTERRARASPPLLSVALLAAVLGAACGRRAAEPASAQVAPATPTTAPAATAAAVDQQWQVEVVQNGQVLPEDGGQVKLARAPFTLRVLLPDAVPVKLNVLDTDANFIAIQPGFVFTADCMVALCTGMDVAEERLNPQKALFVDPLSTHYLYYNGPEDHRWSRAAFTSAGAVFERDVAVLNDTPVEQFQDPALYLLFLVNRDNPDVVDPGELKKLILAFQ